MPDLPCRRKALTYGDLTEVDMRRRTFLGIGTGAVAAASTLAGRPASAARSATTGGPVAPGGLAGGGVACHVVVAGDGSGDFTGIQAAVDAAPAGNGVPFVIGVRPGTYLGRVVVGADRPLVTMVGLGRRPHDVVIADDRANGTPNPAGGTWGTTGSASVTVDG